MSKIKIILTIICLVIVFAGVVYIDNFYLNNSIIKDTRLYSGPVQEDKIINFGGLEISSKNLKDLTEPIGEGGFVLCNINENKCVASSKTNLE